MESDNLNSRILNLIMGRVLKRVYLTLDENGREKMEEIFLSGNDSEKEEFVKKHISDFKEIFQEEAKNIEWEIENEIEGKI